MDTTNEFCEFYINFIHNFNDKTKYFLAEDVVLDYFGHTILGQKNVTTYIKQNIINVKHLFNEGKSVDKIGFRDTHVIKLPKEPKKLVPFFSPPKLSEPKTPPKNLLLIQPSTSKSIIQNEIGQGDCLKKHENTPPKRLRLCHNGGGDGDYGDLFESPIKSFNDIQIKYMITEGYVEFSKPSLKKLQTESKWKRPCKLSIAYSYNTKDDCSIYLIIYEGNLKCKRNLMKEFSEAEN